MTTAIKDTLTLTIPVADSRLQPWDSHKMVIAAFLSKCQGQVKVTFARAKKVRSKPSNSFYWAVPVAMIADETGHDAEEIHEMLKELFLGRRFITVAGVEHEIPKSTAGLTQAEFTVYLDKVIGFAATELGMAIPGPNEI